MKRIIQEEYHFLELLDIALNNRKPLKTDIEEGSGEEIFHLATEHEVASLLYDAAKQVEALKGIEERMAYKSRQIVQQSYHLLFLTRALQELLHTNGIQTVVLKGVATASFYPVPELRKSGDVDILVLEPERFQDACELLEKEGLIKKSRQYHNHHMEYLTKDGILVELHGMLVEPFAEEKMNRYLDEVLKTVPKHTCEVKTCGVEVTTFSDGYHAYYLLLHMLQHLLLAGFGVRYLCDWVVFWNRDIKECEKEIFLHFIRETGLVEFAGTITACCIKYLGLNAKRMDFLNIQKIPEQNVEELMREILDSGEFGGMESERMVAMQGSGLLEYVREFHHQMKINYPKAGKWKIIWPYLWIASLIRFLYNNKKVRKVSSIMVLKKAGQRSKLMKKMHIFSNEA